MSDYELMPDKFMPHSIAAVQHIPKDDTKTLAILNNVEWLLKHDVPGAMIGVFVTQMQESKVLITEPLMGPKRAPGGVWQLREENESVSR